MGGVERRLDSAAISSTEAARNAAASTTTSSRREASDAPLHPLSLAEQERQDVRWYPQKSRRHILKYDHVEIAVLPSHPVRFSNTRYRFDRD
jgi:hypothetical protein